MWSTILKTISFSNLCSWVKENFLSFPSISEGVRHTSKMFTTLTDWPGDNLIHEIIEPDWIEINEFLKTSKDKKVSEKVKFSGERLISLGQRMVDNADRFDEIK